MRPRSTAAPTSPTTTGTTTSALPATTSPVTPTSGTTTSTSSGSATVSTAPASGHSAGSGSGHDTKPKPITETIQRRVDVKVGPRGDLRERTGVKQLTFLPNATNPLVAYLGTNEAGDKAFFLVSADVTSATGDGVCLSVAPSCQYLTLKEGDVETFDYSPDPGTQYELKLLAIKDVVVHKTGG
jgi:hypothetical protein